MKNVCMDKERDLSWSIILGHCYSPQAKRETAFKSIYIYRYRYKYAPSCVVIGDNTLILCSDIILCVVCYFSITAQLFFDCTWNKNSLNVPRPTSIHITCHLSFFPLFYYLTLSNKIKIWREISRKVQTEKISIQCCVAAVQWDKNLW